MRASMYAAVWTLLSAPLVPAGDDDARAALALAAAARGQLPQSTVALPQSTVATWLPDSQGSADLGLWRGTTLVGRYVAATGTYWPWTGTAYGAATSPPMPLPVPMRAAIVPAPVAWAPGFVPRYAPAFGGSSCPPGGCR